MPPAPFRATMAKKRPSSAPGMLSRRSLLRGALTGSLVILVLYLVFGPSRGPARAQGASSRNTAHRTEGSAWVDLGENVPWTSFDGGIEGYSVFSDLYFSGGALVAVVPDEKARAALPKPMAIMSAEQGGPARADRWTTAVGAELARAEFGQRVVRLPGVTYIFNDPPGTAGFMDPALTVSHFLPEVFIPAARAVASTIDDQTSIESIYPSRLMFPRCGVDKSWRDNQSLNAWFIQRALPGVPIEDKMTWDDMSAGEVGYIFDKVVIVDRRSAHSVQGDVSRWGKMNGNMPSVPAPLDFFAPFSSNMIESVGDLLPNVGKYDLPVVVYIDKDGKPGLAPGSHKALVEALKGLTDIAEVHVTKIKAMTRSQKVALMSRTTILISVHGEELLQSVWMPPGDGATVIEIFEDAGFQPDNALLAGLLNLGYIPIQEKHRLRNWRELSGSLRGPGKDSQDLRVDSKALVGIIRDVLVNKEKSKYFQQDV
ncbi:uncharacterized protein LOC62_06G008266 [Vanrija pseudolonga]|uniref:Uncharacterized protein n=1 Tax=Vanrija pseudolonga TaxID=143232 RepID=A0AAF0YDI1_9TREE|nr:hypothetical protein LOC62_06G008266 [Vanrija pseudolonga]